MKITLDVMNNKRKDIYIIWKRIAKGTIMKMTYKPVNNVMKDIIYIIINIVLKRL